MVFGAGKRTAEDSEVVGKRTNEGYSIRSVGIVPRCVPCVTGVKVKDVSGR